MNLKSDEAAAWAVELQDGDPKKQAQFAEWLMQSPQHVEEYLAADALFAELDNAKVARKIDRQKLIAEAMADIRATSPKSELVPSVRRPRHAMYFSIAATLAGIAIVSSVYMYLSAGRQEYITSIGEQRSFDLEDGTVLHLNADSKAQIRFTAEARDIKLITGEALFKVAKDSKRPFRVEAGNAVIQALGTQFNVDRGTQGTTVSVLEGLVQVTSSPASGTRDTSTKIGAGEGVRIPQTGDIKRLPSVDTEKTMAWRQRRLVFLDDPLAEIAVEFNRYNRSPRIRISDDAAGRVLISGVFDADDPESFLLYVMKRKDLTIDYAGQEVVIRGMD